MYNTGLENVGRIFYIFESHYKSERQENATREQAHREKDFWRSDCLRREGRCSGINRATIQKMKQTIRDIRIN